MRIGSRELIMGPTRPTHSVPSEMTPPPIMFESAHLHASTGLSMPAHPLGMKKAVMRPQAMNAPRLGMIMPLRNVPNFCTPTRAPPDVRAAVDSVVIGIFLFSLRG